MQAIAAQLGKSDLAKNVINKGTEFLKDNPNIQKGIESTLQNEVDKQMQNVNVFSSSVST